MCKTTCLFLRVICFLICCAECFNLQPIDVSSLADGKVNNSRGGKSINATMHVEFWKAYREVLLPVSGAEERRNKD